MLLTVDPLPTRASVWVLGSGADSLFSVRAGPNNSNSPICGEYAWYFIDHLETPLQVQRTDEAGLRACYVGDSPRLHPNLPTRGTGSVVRLVLQWHQTQLPPHPRVRVSGKLSLGLRLHSHTPVPESPPPAIKDSTFFS